MPLFALVVVGSMARGREPQTPHAPTEMQYPLSAVVAKDGTVYIADRKLPGIWQWKEGKLSPYFTASKKYRTPLNAVRCVALDADGHLLAGDSATREVYRFDDEGQPHGMTYVPPADGKEPDGPKFGAIGIPVDLAVDDKGAIFVSDAELHRIWRIPAAGGKPEEFAVVAAPRGLDFDPDGNLWCVSLVEDQVRRFDPKGRSTVVLGGRTLNSPHEIVATSAESALVTDVHGMAVWNIRTDHEPKVLHTGPPLQNPVGISAVGENVLIVDPRANGLFEMTSEGTLTAFPAMK